MRSAAAQSASSWKARRTDLGWRGYGSANRTLVRRRDFGYGTREFRGACDLAQRMPYSPRVSALIRSVARDPALIRVLVAIWRLPVVDLRVRRADADAWLGDHASPVGRMIQNARWAQAVLDLPTAEEHYLSGRHRQALRTNLRHARDIGVTSYRVLTYEEWFDAASVILAGRYDAADMAAEITKPELGQRVAYYLASDADKTPLAFARVALFGQFAVLFTMLSHLDRRPSASWARYQLHTFLALDLGSRGAEHLLLGSALRGPVGNQYFEHLLGYRIRNLRVTWRLSGGRSGASGLLGGEPRCSPGTSRLEPLMTPPSQRMGAWSRADQPTLFPDCGNPCPWTARH